MQTRTRAAAAALKDIVPTMPEWHHVPGDLLLWPSSSSVLASDPNPPARSDALGFRV